MNSTSARRARRIVGGTLLGVAAAGVATVALTQSAHATHRPAANDRNAASAAADTTTVSVRGPDLPGLHSAFVPRVQCPGSHPWLLKKQFNEGSGFRIDPGVEFTGYNPGFDAVAMSSLRVPYTKDKVQGHMRTGISGDRDVIMNSVTNWSLGPTGWTVTIHCTSNPADGKFEGPVSDP